MATPSIATLVQRLSSPRQDDQLSAAMQLSHLTADNPASKRRVVKAGAVPSLLHLIDSGSQPAQVIASAALCNLMTIEAVVDAAGPCIPALVGMLKACPSDSTGPAAEALQLLACRGPERQLAIVAAGGMLALLDLCWRSSGPTQEAAAAALCNLVTHEAAAAELVAAGRVPDVLGLLQPGAASTPAALKAAAKALGNLVWRSADATAAAVQAGAPAALVRLMHSGGLDLQLVAMQALDKLASDSGMETLAAIAAAGAIPVVVRQLERSRDPSALQDALLLLSFSTAGGTAPERCREIAATGCIPLVVQLAAGSAGCTAQALAVRLLLEVTSTDSPAISSAVVAAGGIPALVSLLRAIRNSDTLHRAVGVLHNLRLDGHREALLAAGTAAALQPLSHGPNPGVRQYAADELGRLFDNKPSIVMPGAVAMDHPVLGRPRFLPDTGWPTAVSSAAAASTATAPLTPPQPQPQSRPPRVCAAPGCGATHDLRRCGGCGTVRYCSEACCRAHWKAHKAECRRLQAERKQAAAGDEGSS